MKIINNSFVPVVIVAMVLGGCAQKEEEIVYGKTTTQAGPKFFDNSGTLRCSVGSSSLDDVCDYRSIQTHSHTVMWIEDVSSPDLIRHRVFRFDRASKEFTARTREPVTSTLVGSRYRVHVGEEYYLISHRSLTEGYSYKRN